MSKQGAQINLTSKTGAQFHINYRVESTHRVLIFYKKKKAFGLLLKWNFLDVCEHKVFIEPTLLKHFGYTSKLFYKSRKMLSDNSVNKKAAEL